MTYWLLMVMRAIQATGGSPAIGTGSGTVGDIATPGERGRFMGLFQGVALIGPAFGPVLGGILVQYLSWRWIFWVLAIWGGVTVTCLFLLVM
jgi:MFS family permease